MKAEENDQDALPPPMPPITATLVAAAFVSSPRTSFCQVWRAALAAPTSFSPASNPSRNYLTLAWFRSHTPSIKVPDWFIHVVYGIFIVLVK